MSELSTRPYLIRAIYEWCVDSALTPYIAVRIDEQTEVPMAYAKDGEITLSLSANAVRNLEMGNEFITCSGRFGGIPFNLIIPVGAVIGIFSKENGQGLMFQAEDTPPPKPPDNKPAAHKPVLKIVK
ncbi:MAG: ClpXP protease specificity-enhancing factor [Gallionella sp.]